MSRKKGLADLQQRLAALARAGLLREPHPAPPAGALVLCSNDYLGFAREPLGETGAPGGAGASRLISGEHDAHARAEAAIAAWLDVEAALLFTSGYAANVGVLSALAEHGDVIVSDALNHASIIDGCRLSRAAVRVVPHLDLDAVEHALAHAPAAGRRFVVTESYFSMDGNSPDLRRLAAICDRHEAALVVDEAHALGVFGDRGAGLCQQSGVRPDVLIGTLGKAVGVMGAFVAGSELLRSWLWNRARSFVFSTGPSPALASGIAARIAEVAAADDRRRRLEELVTRARATLAARGAPIAPSHGPILPWIAGDSAEALRLSRVLLDRGVFVQAIRPPTVPEGSARLRITLHARLSDAELARALEAFASLL